MDLSLIITCYNEAPHLKKSFSILKNTLNQTRWKYEFIFVDDFSEDRTRNVIEEIINENKALRIKTIFHDKNYGRGQSVVDGLRAAAAPVVGFLDIDLEIAAHYILPAVNLIKVGNADFVMAHRIYKLSVKAMARTIVSRGYNFLTRHLLGLPFHDTEAGFKFFLREKVLPILDLVENQRWFWDTEIVAYAHRNGLKISSLPVLFIRNPDKKTTVKLVSDSFDYFVNLLRFRRRFKKHINYD